jgi:hypothetical protein
MEARLTLTAVEGLRLLELVGAGWRLRFEAERRLRGRYKSPQQRNPMLAAPEFRVQLRLLEHWSSAAVESNAPPIA